MGFLWEVFEKRDRDVLQIKKTIEEEILTQIEDQHDSIFRNFLNIF